jgi:hypothetical protein
MALRFRKRVKIAPGVTVNLGKKGVTSTTIGGRGASVNVGKKGVHTTAGLPGTGLSMQTQVKGPKKQAKAAPEEAAAGGWGVTLLTWVIVFAVAGGLLWWML